MKPRILPRVKRQDDVDALITECQVFFAFSRKQLEEGRAKLPQGEPLIDIGAGGFMPRKHVNTFTQGMKKIEREFKIAMRDEKELVSHIKYELNNHEAYYTRSIESTLDALGEDFTREEVLKVFKGR